MRSSASSLDAPELVSVEDLDQAPRPRYRTRPGRTPGGVRNPASMAGAGSGFPLPARSRVLVIRIPRGNFVDWSPRPGVATRRMAASVGAAIPEPPRLT